LQFGQFLQLTVRLNGSSEWYRVALTGMAGREAGDAGAAVSEADSSVSVGRSR